MRVAIDVTTALTQRAGVGRYTRDLVHALAHLPDGPDLRPFYVAPDAVYELGVGLPVAALRRPIRWWRLAMLLQHAARRSLSSTHRCTKASGCRRWRPWPAGRR